jgi:ferrous iron transport protein A
MFGGSKDMQNIIPLHTMPLGKLGRVRKLTSNGTLRRRMLDLGLTTNTAVRALRQSPFGDPVAYQIRGAVIALRHEEAKHILIELV